MSNLGIYTANLARSRSVYAISDKIAVGYSTYEDVTFEDFMDGLCSPQLDKRPETDLEWVLEVADPFVMVPDQVLTVQRLFQQLNQFLRTDLMVIPDVGDCLWGAADLRLPEHTEFISQAYYTSMGFAIPAAIGAQLGKPDAPADCDRRRWRIPNDRHRVVNNHPLRTQSDHFDSKQQGVWHHSPPSLKVPLTI